MATSRVTGWSGRCGGWKRSRRLIGEAETDLAAAALKFALKPDAVSVVIPGMRNVPAGTDELCRQRPAPDDRGGLQATLRKHAWHRSFWYGGK